MKTTHSHIVSAICAISLLIATFAVPASGAASAPSTASTAYSGDAFDTSEDGPLPDDSSVPPAADALDPPHDIVHFLHSVTGGESAKYFNPTVSTVNYFDTTLDFSPVEQIAFGQSRFAVQWFMYPALASNLTTEEIDVVVWINGTAATGLPNFSGNVSVYEITEANLASSDTVGTLAYFGNIGSNTPLYENPSVPFIFNLAGAYTFAAGSTLRVVVAVNPGASGSGQYTNVTVHWDEEHRYDSRVVMHVQNPMTIEGTWTEDAGGTLQSSFLTTDNDKNMSFHANVSDPFGCYDVKWVNLTVYDGTGTPFPGLDNASMAMYDGNNLSAWAKFGFGWNYSGLAQGVYRYDVWAVDNSGYTFYHYFGLLSYAPYDETVTNWFSIGVVHNLTAHLNDTLGHNMAGALVEFAGATTTSNATGWVSMLAFGNGTLRVRWHGETVYDSSIVVMNDTMVYLTCAVYYPSIVFVDSRGLPLPAASVFFVYPDGYRPPVIFTNSVGSTGPIPQVPLGNSSASAWWRGAQVFNGTVRVSSNSPITIICTVYYLTVTALDPWGDPLAMANVVVKDAVTHILLDSQTVNGSGVVVSRLPKGVYDVEVYWHGCLSCARYDVALNSDMSITLVGAVSIVNFTAVDERNNPLVGAHLVASSPTEVIVSAVTDANGSVRAALPNGTFNVRVYWYGVLVNSSSVTVSGDANVTIRCSVYYVTLTTVDSQGLPLQCYLVVESAVSHEVVGAGTTDEYGSLTLKVAAGAYHVSAYWQGVLVYDELDLHLGSGTDVELACAVFHLACHAVDSLEAPVGNASLRFVLSGTSVDVSATTGYDGNCSVRLPVGSYALTAMWMNTIVNRTDGLPVDADASLDIACAVYYLDLALRDSAGAGLEGAAVRLTSHTAGVFEAVSGPDGSVSFIVPMSIFHTKTYWWGVTVNATEITVASNTHAVLNCSVYYPHVKPLDSRSVILEGATVNVYTDEEVVASGVCGVDGWSLRAPAGTWRFEVRWQGVVVADSSFDVDGSGEIPVECSVSYLTVKATDSGGRALDGVEIGVFASDGKSLGSAETVSGQAEFRLPDQPVTVKGRLSREYMMTHIDIRTESPATLNGDAEMALEFAGYPPQVYETTLFLLAALGAVCAILAIFAAVLFIKLRKVLKGKVVLMPVAEPKNPNP